MARWCSRSRTAEQRNLDATVRSTLSVRFGTFSEEGEVYVAEGSGTRSYTWVKNRLQEAGLVKKGRRKGPHRERRERKPAVGRMRHQDASTHEWVPGESWDLVVTMDDATGEVLSGFFVAEEGTWSSGLPRDPQAGSLRRRRPEDGQGRGGRVRASAALLGSLRSPRRPAEPQSGHFTCSENRTLHLFPTATLTLLAALGNVYKPSWVTCPARQANPDPGDL